MRSRSLRRNRSARPAQASAAWRVRRDRRSGAATRYPTAAPPAGSARRPGDRAGTRARGPGTRSTRTPRSSPRWGNRDRETSRRRARARRTSARHSPTPRLLDREAKPSAPQSRIIALGHSAVQQTPRPLRRSAGHGRTSRARPSEKPSSARAAAASIRCPAWRRRARPAAQGDLASLRSGTSASRGHRACAPSATAWCVRRRRRRPAEQRRDERSDRVRDRHRLRRPPPSRSAAPSGSASRTRRPRTSPGARTCAVAEDIALDA